MTGGALSAGRAIVEDGPRTPRARRRRSETRTVNHAQLTALGRALRVLGEHGEKLTADTPEALLHEIRGDLTRALDQLDDAVTGQKPTTRCNEHPYGPVDKAAPDLCLFCETRRRKARR